MSDMVVVVDGSSPVVSPGVQSAALAWRAVIGGALVAVAATLILAALGSGIGLSIASPFPGSGASAGTIGVAAVIWLVVTQWIASGMGGYLAGRLRTKWVGVHTHEVFFRDTAHGFLAWALATVITAVAIASIATGAVGAGTRAAATVASGAMQGAGQAAGNGYYVDSLFRSDHPAADTSTADVRGEAGRILAMGLRNGDVSAADRGYLANLVAARTGLSPADARTRVDNVIGQAKAAEQKVEDAADTARKNAARLSIVTALAMLIGAFIASVAGAVGGHERDA